MARTLTVVMGHGWAEFAGYGSRELYVVLRRRPPVYNTRTRRWTAQLETARDLVALAESRGWSVFVSGAPPGRAHHTEPRVEQISAERVTDLSTDPLEGLW